MYCLTVQMELEKWSLVNVFLTPTYRTYMYRYT